MMPLLCVELIAAAAVFAGVWILCVRIKNYGFLDVTWTLAIGLLAVIDCARGSGAPLRRAIYAGIGAAWSLRLGLFVLVRVMRHHPTEDKRYGELRERWKTPGQFLVFFELQALIAVAFSLPFLVASLDRDPSLTYLQWAGLSIAVSGFLGETIADAQAAAFKGRRRASGVLDAGLWRYSRHPNYFFEWVFWMGIAIMTAPLPGGYVALICPLLIAYFLLRVTGIPLTERFALKTHGDEYRDYQRRTSRFVPWPPKRPFDLRR